MISDERIHVCYLAEEREKLSSVMQDLGATL